MATPECNTLWYQSCQTAEARRHGKQRVDTAINIVGDAGANVNCTYQQRELLGTFDHNSSIILSLQVYISTHYGGSLESLSRHGVSWGKEHIIISGLIQSMEQRLPACHRGGSWKTAGLIEKVWRSTLTVEDDDRWKVTSAATGKRDEDHGVCTYA